MKKIKYILLSLFATSMLFSCDIEADFDDELSGGATTGGLVSLNNPAIGYVVGNDATYTASGTVYQGNVQTQTIEVYKSFNSSATGSTSNEELLTTMVIGNTGKGSNGTFEFSFTYEDLIAGLTLDGAPLPDDDGLLSIGDAWTLRYVSKTSDGNSNSNGSTTNVSVGTRFAGKYAVIEQLYFRIGVNRDDVAWPAEMQIESIDATTYRQADFFGAFDGNELFFQIDVNDNITYPENNPSGDPQLGNGEPLTTCDRNLGDLTNVPCNGSNTVIRDDVNGKDQLIMTYGYFTAGSGPREFYQVLEKIVE